MTTRGPRKNLGRLADLQRETKVPEPYVLTPEIVIEVPSRARMRAAREAKSPEEYNQTFFGEQYDAINELFDNQPEALYSRFIQDVGDHFFGPGADDVEGKSRDSSES